MKLYDKVIKETGELLLQWNPQRIDMSHAKAWKDAGKSNMVFRSDMAFELGGDVKGDAALGATFITADASLVPADGACLIGPDLWEIKESMSYARVALVRVSEEQMGEGEKLYNSIRNLEYVRYHFNPEGFMMRVSTAKGRESVRVSKAAIENGLTFTEVAQMLCEAYHKKPAVEAVQIYFITDPAFPFTALEGETLQAEEITKTIDHMLKNVMTDCDVCSLQKVCDEVEGLKELHFKKPEP